MKNTPQFNAKDAAKRKMKQGTSSSDGKQRAQDGPETDGLVYTTWFDRAQGFRAWQEKLRYNEAVNILCAEFCATIRERTTVPGERAYTLQHHAMFTCMSHACQAAYDEARADGIDADTIDQSKSIHCFLKKQVSDMGQWERVLRKLKA
ncbi:hypothetical protein K466DRAFT_562748 [Polyporus arcularius HHB13444]|uniref:Uncharacterized protein n=1 Tax=Polyporus arcularius HHB13444 TaxID=1314778 RepID=A0A5C3PRF3_9APHY|nr:hypothetical protein K466DRAFT_562748 [Polyporus arcularius HHB13444]